MILSSEIISKAVLNLYSGKIEGTVKNVCFDQNLKKMRFIKMFDENEEEYLIETNRIYKIGKTCVVIKNADAMVLAVNENTPLENNPINKQIYTSNGENLGRLCDVEINEKYEVKNLICNDKKIEISNILNIGETIIINTSDKKIKLSNFRPKNTMASSNLHLNLVTIMPTNNEVKYTNLDNALAYNKKILKSSQIQDDAMDIIKEIDPTNITSENIKQNDPIKQDATKDAQVKDLLNNDLFTAQASNDLLINDKKEPFKIYNQPTPQRLIGDGNFLIGRKAVKTIYGINNEIIIKKDSIINQKNLENAKRHSKLVELTVFSKIKS